MVSEPHTLGFCAPNYFPCLAHSRAAAKSFFAKPHGLENTHDAVMHVHKFVVSTPNKRAQTRETISEVRKIICPSDGLFPQLGPKERPSPGEENKICQIFVDSYAGSSVLESFEFYESVDGPVPVYF